LLVLIKRKLVSLAGVKLLGGNSLSTVDGPPGPLVTIPLPAAAAPVKYAQLPPEINKNGEKTGGFPHFLAYKSPKTPFFAKKYLTRYTPETFFEEYISYCGVIPFGSHLRPQPQQPGLWLS
jgi:hypothetical protein